MLLVERRWETSRPQTLLHATPHGFVTAFDCHVQDLLLIGFDPDP